MAHPRVEIAFKCTVRKVSAATTVERWLQFSGKNKKLLFITKSRIK